MGDFHIPVVGVVCYGNILRSQVLAAYLRQEAAAQQCRYTVYDAGVCDDPQRDFPNAAQALYEVQQRLNAHGLPVQLQQTVWSDQVAAQLARCTLILAADEQIRHLLRQRLAKTHPPLYGFYELIGEGAHDFPDTYDYEQNRQRPDAFEHSFEELHRVARGLSVVLHHHLCQPTL